MQGITFTLNALTIKGKLPAIQFDSSPGAFEITNSILSSSNDHIVFNSSSPNGVIKDNNISTNNSGNGIRFTFIPSNLLVTNNCFENIPDEEGYILFSIFSPLPYGLLIR